MKNEQTPRRKPVMRGALEGGCASWAPIRPENDAASGNATASNEPLTTPDAVSNSNRKPSPASDAER